MKTTIATALLAALAATQASAETPVTGAETFANVCSACHGPAGEGIPGLAPPLADPPMWEGLGANAPEYISGVVISGLSGNLFVQGQGYYGLIMPSQDYMTDEELAGVTNYVLNEVSGVDPTIFQDDAETSQDEDATPTDGAKAKDDKPAKPAPSTADKAAADGDDAAEAEASEGDGLVLVTPEMIAERRENPPSHQDLMALRGATQ